MELCNVMELYNFSNELLTLGIKPTILPHQLLMYTVALNKKFELYNK